jgi:hypothetical protein
LPLPEGLSDDGAPIGPSADEEASLLVEDGAAPPGAKPSRENQTEEVDLDSSPLPPMDELVHRIPESARDMIEELFRARFVTVKRFPKKLLKS